MTEVEIRTALEEVINEFGKSYTWVTGEVEFELRSGERIRGQLQYLEPASAIIDGPRGLQAILIRDMTGIQVTIESPGPE